MTFKVLFRSIFLHNWVPFKHCSHSAQKMTPQSVSGGFPFAFYVTKGGDEALHVRAGCCVWGHPWHHHLGLLYVLPQVKKDTIVN